MTQVNQIQKRKLVMEKILDTRAPVKKTDYNSKISEIENKIPSITGLGRTSTLTTVEYDIPDFSNLVKKQIIMRKY